MGYKVFNLILKDILIQKRTFLLGIVYILIMILSFQQSGSPMFSASVTAFSYIMVQSACAYDDKNKSDILLNSLPLNRNTIVIARYISTFIFAAIAVVYYILLTGIIKILELPFKVYPVSLEGIIGTLFALILVSGIYFPIFFKVGYIKSKIVNFVLFFGVFIGGGILLPELIENKNKAFIQGAIQFLSNQSDMQIAVEIFAIMILLLIISYVFSLKFYRKREF
ncbi:ABC-2 transporter permease [Thermoanaerobacterium sp. CMT5567-10]|uniref:ABC-2 transporter permease n=1 Tax=Thermoanaerobacterium sp. CMT5567-10 TaxID=3061989 RepID=UPI00287F7488|nr:ABC-2 transporter permease [Thermoanaerobacterium sp. CMT5567-10]WKV08575.2 ABC-2 transporter permease [Thermoanaerobacterium sp. CMT5567-10]